MSAKSAAATTSHGTGNLGYEAGTAKLWQELMYLFLYYQGDSAFKSCAELVNSDAGK
jgi:hypothetical protein